MTVAYKDPLSLQLAQQSQRPLIERNQNLETGLFPRTTREVGNSPVLGDPQLYFQALREMLESDDYQVALVPRGRWDLIPGSQAEQFSTPASAVLIPFRWTELVAQVHEFLRESNILPECRIARFEDVCVDFIPDGSESVVGRTNHTDYPGVQNAQMFLVESGSDIFASRIAVRGVGIQELSFNPYRRQPCLETAPET